jgi:PA14 domain
MVMMRWKWSLAAALLTLVVGCGQPPTPPSGAFEVSDEAGNSVTTQAVPINGLKGEYFDNVDFTGTMKLRYDATVNRNFGTAAPITGIQPTTYSVRWTGQVKPAFSETYTFRVTSSDGARLMVNGQVLVSDWTDGASRVRTGMVALQANVKYDLRVEYYRNATNPGSIKLEWQSFSRTRQVVPQANLFPESLDAQTAIAALKAAVPAADPDLTFTLTQKGVAGTYFFTRNKQGQTYYFGFAKPDGSTLGVQSLAVNGTTATFTDFNKGKSAIIGNFPGYFNTDGSVSSQQRYELAKRIAPAMTAIQMELVPPQTLAAGGARTQSAADCFVPPPSCSDDCKGKAKAYGQNECGRLGNTVQALAGVALVVFSGGTVAVVAVGLIAAGGAGIASIPNWENELPLLNQYRQCLKDQKCLPILLVDPAVLSIEVPVGALASGNFTVSNSVEVDQSSPLKTLKGSTTGTGLADPSFALDPGQSRIFTYLKECPLTPTTISDTITVTQTPFIVDFLVDGPASIQTKTIAVTVNCVGQPLQLLAALSDRVNLGYACENFGFTDYPCLGFYWYVIATTPTCNSPTGSWPTRDIAMCGTGVFIDGHDGSATANITTSLNAAGITNVSFGPCRAGTTVPWSNTTPPTTCVYGNLP